jgi:hypothetical protein
MLSALFDVLMLAAEGVGHLFGEAVGRRPPRIGQRFCARSPISISGCVLGPSSTATFSVVLPVGTRVRIVREGGLGEDGCGAVFVNDESLMMLPPSLHEKARAYGYTLELTPRALHQFFSFERTQKNADGGH